MNFKIQACKSKSILVSREKNYSLSRMVMPTAVVMKLPSPPIIGVVTHT